MTPYLLLRQSYIKQASDKRGASTCRWADAHVVVEQEQARGSANSAWQHQLISATCLLGTEEHMLMSYDNGQHLNHTLYSSSSVATRAKGIVYIIIHFS